MTEAEQEAHRLKTIINQHLGWMEDINNTVLNFTARVDSLEKMFVEYMEENPKTNDEWTEARLRHLEDAIEKLQNTNRKKNNDH